jgi:5-methylcytosine-specific restriction endonuclease McrA
MLRVELARPACRVCRGQGVCPCASCDARRSEQRSRTRPLAELITPSVGGQQAVTHDGRTCHRCWGLGRSPFVAFELRHETRRPAYKRRRREIIDAWVAENGPTCPGYGRPPHQVEPSYLTLDHYVPLVRGGAADDPADLRILCRSCTARKNRINPVAGPAAQPDSPEFHARLASWGANLRATRERLGIDLPDLARRSRFSQVFLEAVESGEIVARHDQRDRIEWALVSAGRT